MKTTQLFFALLASTTCSSTNAKKSFLRSMYHQAKELAVKQTNEVTSDLTCFSIKNQNSCASNTNCEWASCEIPMEQIGFCAPSYVIREVNKVCSSITEDLTPLNQQLADDTESCIALPQRKCSNVTNSNDLACEWCECSLYGNDFGVCLPENDADKVDDYCDCGAADDGDDDDDDDDLMKLFHSAKLSESCYQKKTEGNCTVAEECAWCSCDIFGYKFDVCASEEGAEKASSYCDCDVDDLFSTRKEKTPELKKETCETIREELNCTSSTGFLSIQCEWCSCSVYGQSFDVCVEQDKEVGLFCSCDKDNRKALPESNMEDYNLYNLYSLS